MDEIIEWYDFVEASIRLARNTTKHYPPPERVYDRTLFGRAFEESPESFQELRQKPLPSVLEQLNEATVVLLYAAFERSLLLHLQDAMFDILAEKEQQPWLGELALMLPEKAERWQIREILELFRKQVTSNLIGQMKALYDYRNWLAHGKKGDAPPRILPRDAYARFKSFLQTAQIHER